MPEGIEEIDPVRKEDDVGAGADGLIEQANSVGSSQMTFGDLHRSALLSRQLLMLNFTNG